MGKELEYKLHIDSPAVLERVLADAELNALTDGPWMETAMKTTYFDGADRRFTARKWTLRHRFEGGESVVCLKTPQEERHTRGEWQVGAETVDAAAVAALLEAGAPQELRELYADGDVRPVCGAEFVRKHVMLRFPDGSRAELAGDSGILRGPTEELSFTELELELYDGAPDAMLAQVRRLCELYGLHEEPLSKSARARRLR